jgi:hypothetical protein
MDMRTADLAKFHAAAAGAALIAALILPGAATGAESARADAPGEEPPPLVESELSEALAGSTLILPNEDGSTRAEFHTEDGRVFGRTGNQASVEGCWWVAGDKVCYRYKSRREGPNCWHVVQRANGAHLLISPRTGRRISALITPGDSYAHYNPISRWHCPPAMALRERARFAAR